MKLEVAAEGLIEKAPEWYQVVLMGLVTVFVVLISLIVIIKILGAIMSAVSGKNHPEAGAPVSTAPVPQAVQAAPSAQPDKQKLVAAIAAAIAEDMGSDVTHIKIHSIRKL